MRRAQIEAINKKTNSPRLGSPRRASATSKTTPTGEAVAPTPTSPPSSPPTGAPPSRTPSSGSSTTALPSTSASFTRFVALSSIPITRSSSKG
ncbi:hypothetical protein U1Q18_039816 [Sarracenia purpurea var. burkii]